MCGDNPHTCHMISIKFFGDNFYEKTILENIINLQKVILKY